METLGAFDGAHNSPIMSCYGGNNIHTRDMLPWLRQHIYQLFLKYSYSQKLK